MRSLLVGLILGMVIGLALGLLAAPTEGAQTRHKLRERTEPTIDRVRERMRREEAA